MFFLLKQNLLRIFDNESKANFKFIIKCVFICILINFAGFGFAGQEVNTQRELTERLEKLVEQLRAERSDYYTQKDQYESQIQKARENQKILKDELDELSLQEEESDKQIQKYKDEVGDIKKELTLKTTLENIIREQAQPFLANQKTIIEKGIPYKQKERLSRLETASAGSDVDEPNNISAAEQLEKIWNYSLEELRIGRSSETYTSRAKTSDNALPYARYFRVGHLISGYITEDGKLTAMWLPIQKRSDYTVVNEKKQSEQIRSAVEILDQHQPPELIELPVSFNLVNAKEDSNAPD